MGEPLILGLSIASGSVLSLFSILYGYALLNYFESTSSLIIWVLMISTSYVMALGWNAIVQKVSCNTISPRQIAMASILTPIAMFFGLILSTFLSSPVINVLPIDIRTSPMSNYIAIGFYAFWAGMFGEVIGAGLSQNCPKL